MVQTRPGHRQRHGQERAYRPQDRGNAALDRYIVGVPPPRRSQPLGDLGVITEGDVVLAITWSGETAELRDIFDYCHRLGSQADRGDGRSGKHGGAGCGHLPGTAPGAGGLPQRSRYVVRTLPARAGRCAGGGADRGPRFPLRTSGSSIPAAGWARSFPPWRTSWAPAARSPKSPGTPPCRAPHWK